MKTLYLSPSTQEHNLGAEKYGTEECRMNQLCDLIEKKLNQYSLIIYRNKPEMSLGEVVTDSNIKNVDMHLAIHSNASGNSQNGGIARGCEVLVYSKESKAYEFADIIYKHLAPITPSGDRGIKISPKLYELRKTKAPAIIIEVAFHDNIEDALFIINQMELISEAIYDGILEIFNYSKIPQKDYKNLYQNEASKRQTLETLVIKIKSALETLISEISS